MIMNVYSNFWIVFCDETFFVKHTNNTTSNRLSNCFEKKYTTIHKQNPHHSYTFEIYWMQLTLMCSIHSFKALTHFWRLQTPKKKKKRNIISRIKISFFYTYVVYLWSSSLSMVRFMKHFKPDLVVVINFILNFTCYKLISLVDR